MSVMHLGRSWPGMGNPIERDCPCEKAACGLAIPCEECPEHNPRAAKTMRQGHLDADCCATADNPRIPREGPEHV